MSGDKITALIGLVLSLMIVSRSGTFRKMTTRQRFIYGAWWAVIIGLGALIVARLAPAGTL